ncbi:MAG TPA: PRC-barrel domain-containing protein [Burkholderiales bacterium]|nr:PRC-barrel domain-containing protein [Burkholderiales bacterium]
MANTRDTRITGADTPSTTGSTGSLAGSAPSSGGAAILGGATRPGNEGPGPRLMTASTLEGDDIVNRQGDKLGELEEVMLDVTTGRIAYAVMSAGGFLGMGDKLFAIPWSALTMDPENHCFILDADKERLERAPGFDKDHWPSMADAGWATEVHSYYGQRPYWE